MSVDPVNQACFNELVSLGKECVTKTVGKGTGVTSGVYLKYAKTLKQSNHQAISSVRIKKNTTKGFLKRFFGVFKAEYNLKKCDEALSNLIDKATAFVNGETSCSPEVLSQLRQLEKVCKNIFTEPQVSSKKGALWHLFDRFRKKNYDSLKKLALLQQVIEGKISSPGEESKGKNPSVEEPSKAVVSSALPTSDVEKLHQCNNRIDSLRRFATACGVSCENLPVTDGISSSAGVERVVTSVSDCETMVWHSAIEKKNALEQQLRTWSATLGIDAKEIPFCAITEQDRWTELFTRLQNEVESLKGKVFVFRDEIDRKWKQYKVLENVLQKPAIAITLPVLPSKELSLPEVSGFSKELLTESRKLEAACLRTETSSDHGQVVVASEIDRGLGLLLEEYQKKFTEQYATLVEIRKQMELTPLEAVSAPSSLEEVEGRARRLSEDTEETKKMLFLVQAKLIASREGLLETQEFVQEKKIVEFTDCEGLSEKAVALQQFRGSLERVYEELRKVFLDTFGVEAPPFSGKIVEDVPKLRLFAQNQVKIAEGKKADILEKVSGALKDLPVEEMSRRLDGDRNVIQAKRFCSSIDIQTAQRHIQEAVQAKKLISLLAEVSTKLQKPGQKLFLQRLEKLKQIDPNCSSESLCKQIAQVEDIQRDAERNTIKRLQEAIVSDFTVLAEEAPAGVQQKFEQVIPAQNSSVDELERMTKELESIKAQLTGTTKRKEERESLKALLHSDSVDEGTLIQEAERGPEEARQQAIHMRVYGIVDGLRGGNVEVLLQEFVRKKPSGKELDFLIKMVQQKNPAGLYPFLERLGKRFFEEKIAVPKEVDGALPCYSYLVALASIDRKDTLTALVQWGRRDPTNEKALAMCVTTILEMPLKAFIFETLATLLPENKVFVEKILANVLPQVSDRETLRSLVYYDKTAVKQLAVAAGHFSFTAPWDTDSLSTDMSYIRCKDEGWASIEEGIAAYNDSICLALSKIHDEPKQKTHPLFIGRPEAFAVDTDEEFSTLYSKLASLSHTYPGVTIVSGGIKRGATMLSLVFEDGRLLATCGEGGQNYLMLPNGVTMAVGVGEKALEQAKNAIKSLPLKKVQADIQVCLGPISPTKRVVASEGIFIGPEDCPPPRAIAYAPVEKGAVVIEPIAEETWKAVQAFDPNPRFFFDVADGKTFTQAVRRKDLRLLMSQYRQPFLRCVAEATRQKITLVTDSPSSPLEQVGDGGPGQILYYSFAQQRFYSLDGVKNTEGYKTEKSEIDKAIVNMDKTIVALGVHGKEAHEELFRDTIQQLIGESSSFKRRYVSSRGTSVGAYLARADMHTAIEKMNKKTAAVLAFCEDIGKYNERIVEKDQLLKDLTQMVAVIDQAVALQIATGFRADQTIETLIAMANNPSWQAVTVDRGILTLRTAGWLRRLLGSAPQIDNVEEMQKFFEDTFLQLARIAPYNKERAESIRNGLKSLAGRGVRIDKIMALFNGE